MSIPDEVRNTLDRAFKESGYKRLPKASWLAEKFAVTEDGAQAWNEEYKGEILTRGANPIQVQTIVKEVEVKTKLTTGQKIAHFVDKLVDSGSLWFAVAIDLIMNGIGFYIIGPNAIMKWGMVCISFIVVLFSVRAWIKRSHVLWAMFAFVASFMDTSFALLATDVQSSSVGVDTELSRLTDQVEKASSYLSTLQRMQEEKGSGYATQIKDQTATLQTANQNLISYKAKPRKSDDNNMSASRVATAIPDAILSGKWDRWIFLLIFTTVFVGLQLTIISATGVKWRDK
jgi:hypothetical protein